MEYFKSFTHSNLSDLIKGTKKNLFLCLPSIHKELADAILSLSNLFRNAENEPSIHLLIDFDAQTFRQGYGDYKSVDNLIQHDIELKTLNDNRISFIISDDIGYYLFIESRSLIPADKVTINAIKIDPVSKVRLKKYFFGSAININIEDELTNAIIEESQQLDTSKELLSNHIANASEISEKKLEDVADDLERNPPLNPDYKRIVEFYTNKFQYVKLKLEGAYLQHRKIEIPKDALPIADAELRERLETKLDLFDPDSNANSFLSLRQLKDDVQSIRANYLRKIKSREESLLNKNDKHNFVKELEILKSKIKLVKQQSLNDIASQIFKSKERLLNNLANFLVENPKALFPDHPDLWENNLEYKQITAKDKANKIVHSIRWPEPHKMVDELKFDIKYSDITFEDLKDPKFASELKESGLISSSESNQLTHFNRGIVIDN